MRRLGAGFLADGGRPLAPLPIEALGGRLFRHAFPPDAAFGRERDVGEDGVARERGHGVRVGLDRSAGRDAKEAGFGIDGAKAAVFVGLNPRDIVADGPYLPSLETVGRHQHGEIGLAAGAGECRGDVGLLAFGIFDAEDQHVLGQPAFIARDIRRDAQREAFLAQQRIAAVAGTVGPDFAGFREVNDVLLFVAGPGNIRLAGLERRAHGVHAGDDALGVLIDFAEYRQADARHDAHVDHDVRRIGQLHADLGHGRIDGPHAEGEHVHSPSAHGAVEKALELAAHLERIDPVVGGSGGVPRERADESAVFDARDVVRVRARVIAAGPELFVELGEGAALHHLGADGVALFL